MRNNSPTQILTPFSVQLLASTDQVPRADLPQSGVVIPTMDIGETQVLDIRLPLAANRLGLTPREVEVLALIAAGLTNRQIGNELYVSAKTASVHISNILRKLNVKTRVDLPKSKR